MAERRYWLVKSEPTAYSFADLLAEPDRTAEWDGVRDYQARNFMRHEMKVGDGILFQHSSSASPAVVGIARVVREGYPDDTAWDLNSKHYDAKSTPANPVWFMVDIQGEEELATPVTLAEIKQNPKLQNMMVVRKGARLSIQPVAQEEWDEIIGMAKRG